MRNNTEDRTIERNYISKWRFLIGEYQLIKAKKHSKFKFVTDFYKHHDTNRQTFLKYYNRYLIFKKDNSLLPQTRGPKYKTGRPNNFIEQQVIELRLKTGKGRYELHNILKEKLKQFTPSPSGIYNILCRHNLNTLTPKLKQKKRMIIKEKAGELGHIDCHHLSKEIILKGKRYYLVAVVDSCTRILWMEVVEDLKALTIMFSVLRIFNMIQGRYGIKFEEVLTDNGAEFGSGKNTKNKMGHPFERMLMELEVKHRYTRPYRPQTNGKVERVWRTVEEELIEGAVYESIEAFRDELLHYLVYYNEHRPHQSLGGKTPLEFHNSKKKDNNNK